MSGGSECAACSRQSAGSAPRRGRSTSSPPPPPPPPPPAPWPSHRWTGTCARCGDKIPQFISTENISYLQKIYFIFPKNVIYIYRNIFHNHKTIFHIYQKNILHLPISFYFVKVRIEFETLILADPNKNGVCDQEYIEVRVIHIFIYNNVLKTLEVLHNR